MKIKILLVEDDVNLGFVISDQLNIFGYDVILSTDGNEAFKQFNKQKFDLCILDIMMPKKDGFSLAQDIRKVDKDVPILFLSAKNLVEDKVKGFNVGGDDYLTKPFSSEELEVRIKALLKRTNPQIEEKEIQIADIGKYTFDIPNYLLKGPNFEKKLTKKEAHILQMLYKFTNKVISREMVLNAVWGKDDYFTGRSLDVFITKLRKHLSNDASISIENIHGIGFKLNIEEN